jgi:hypothetical protein
VSNRILVSYELCLELAAVNQDGVAVVLAVHQENGRGFGGLEKAAIEDFHLLDLINCGLGLRGRKDHLSLLAFPIHHVYHEQFVLHKILVPLAKVATRLLLPSLLAAMISALPY